MLLPMPVYTLNCDVRILTQAEHDFTQIADWASVADDIYISQIRGTVRPVLAKVLIAIIIKYACAGFPEIVVTDSGKIA